jgi:hypothetical protein
MRSITTIKLKTTSATNEACPLEELSFDDIFQIIRSDDSIKEMITRYHRITNEKERVKFKADFPSFYPTVFLGQVNINSLCEKSVPTEIVQFDIDRKANPDMNDDHFAEIREKIQNFEYTVYCFISPSNGLKFGILTDFVRGIDEPIAITQDRYRQAYALTKSFVMTILPDVVFDDCVGVLKHACFFSYDPKAYYNPNCWSILVNHKCFSSKKPSEPVKEYPTADSGYIQEMLLSITDKDSFNYDQRFLVNMAVFNAIGENGIAMMFNFWTAAAQENPTKLLIDLKNQYRDKDGYKTMGFLVNLVRNKYGYPKAVTGSKRKSLEPKSLTEKAISENRFLSLMLSPEEAKEYLNEELQLFFNSDQNTCINFSAGAGKTYLTLQFLKGLSNTKKVLYLVRDHNLAEQNVLTFNSLPKTLKRFVPISSQIVHLKGKTQLCELPEVVQKYSKAGMAIPVMKCLGNCPHFAQCQYTLQFAGMENIRMMPLNELLGTQSFFFNSIVSLSAMDADDGEVVVKNNTYTKGQAWIPDYIVVDEDWLSKETVVEDLSSQYDCVREVLNECLRGTDLIISIEIHFQLILTEYREMMKLKTELKYTNDDDYIKNNVANKGKWSAIVETMRNYCVSKDEDVLANLRVEIEDKKMVLSGLKTIQDRYANVPKLFLDATANEALIKQVIPDIRFVNINIKKKSDVRILQAQNFNFTKESLKKEHTKKELIAGLKRLIKNRGYQNVGLITYLNVGEQKKFDQWLANEIGISLYGHFGNIRGNNSFENCDCIFIVGRHSMPPNELQEFAIAIFNDKKCSIEREYIDTIARQPNDQYVSINNFAYVDNQISECYQHFCQAETIQSVGRGRLIYGCPKDIWHLSNESLGINIEVDEFIRYDDYFYQPKGASENILKIGGCIKNKPKELEAVFGRHLIDNKRGEIEQLLIDEGYELITKTVTSKTNRNKRVVEFWALSEASLELYCDQQGYQIRQM